MNRLAVAAITGTHTRGEEFAVICDRQGLESNLSLRRLRLAQSFAKRTADNSCHQDMFYPCDTGRWQDMEGAPLPDPAASTVGTTIYDKAFEWRDTVIV